MSLSAQQRFTKQNPCPICGGGNNCARGKGQRCAGYLSSDGGWAFCTREEHAGALTPESQTEPPAYRHLVRGGCGCGVTHRPASPKPRIVATYDYTDAAGSLRFQVVRYSPKNFVQRRPDGSSGWIWDIQGVEPVLYRLPAVLVAIAAGRTIFANEGEACVDAMVAAGAVATCNPMGAGKWRDSFSLVLKDAARIVIVADNDEPGRKHARAVLASLLRAGASDVTVVTAATGNDAADHLAAGKTLDEFIELSEPTRGDLSDLTVDAILAANPDLSKQELLEGNPLLKALLGGGRASQSTMLVKLALEAGATLFHDGDLRPYVSFEHQGCLQTWPVGSAAVRLYLRRLFYERHDVAIAAQPITDAITTLEAQAVFEGERLEVHRRVAADGQAIVIDLGDPAWRAVRITAQGWALLDRHPVRFRRARGIGALPAPVRGGSLEELRPFLNLATEDDWRLAVAFLLAALRPPGHPYPVLGLHGEQGSAKSTAARLLRLLIDPSTVPLRAAPRDVRDLMISASASWVVSLDNLTQLQPWLSDALCRLSTGGGFATRELYADEEEILFEAQRPVIINGIEELATRSDLLDRSLLIQLPTILPEARRPEREFWNAFDEARPRILGALYDAIACALGNSASTELPRLPRMADFAIWVTAAEPALAWEPHSFLDSYEHNRGQGNELAIDASLIGASLRDLAAIGFEGTATELLHRLTASVDDATARHAAWPKNGRKLSGELKRLAPNLRALGVNLTLGRREAGTGRRLLTISQPDKPHHESRPANPSQPSPPQHTPTQPRDGRDGRDAAHTQTTLFPDTKRLTDGPR